MAVFACAATRVRVVLANVAAPFRGRAPCLAFHAVPGLLLQPAQPVAAFSPHEPFALRRGTAARDQGCDTVEEPIETEAVGVIGVMGGLVLVAGCLADTVG